MSKPLLIIQTGNALPKIKSRLGDFPHWFRVSMKLKLEQVHVIQAQTGMPLPEPNQFSGALITGSGAMVTDKADWSESIVQWIRQAHAAELPLLGVCYGHQLLAHALGGKVDFNPRGREIGTVAMTLTEAASNDPIFGQFPKQLLVHTTHLQTVLQPPPGATVLGHSEFDDCHAFRIGQSWGMQFHPEFSVKAMHSYVDAKWQDMHAEGMQVHAVRQAVRSTPLARQALKRFSGLVLKRKQSL